MNFGHNEDVGPHDLNKATGTDQMAGYGMVSLALAIFCYYTIWVIVLPFVEPGHAIKSYFPPQALAMLLPIAAGVVVLVALGIFIGYITMKSQTKPKSS